MRNWTRSRTWTWKLKGRAALGGLLLAVLTGCNLENELDVVLPAYTDELVVECYLEAGTVPRLTVLQSGPYLPPVPDRPTITLPTAATPVLGVALPSGQSVAVPIDVTASLTLPNGQVVPLRFAPGIDPVTRKYFTHVGTAPLAMQPGQRFALTVQDTRGRRVTGTAAVPTLVPIDSVRYGFNGLSGNDRRANFVTRWTDPAATADFYRLLLNNGRDDINDSASDSPLDDKLFNGQSYTSLTTYRFRPNDTLTATLFHMEPEYYSFQQSIREAVRATGNPFSQPARIRNTVQGGLGVFAVLVADRRTLILK